MWTADRLRRAFIEYFESVGHKHWKSSSVSPDDPTLLFANSGMVQFKKKFLDLASSGTEYGSLKRACNYQKCIRAGGKHNDLDDVGKDTYHHTFFEMLGNWSFGDYFKKETIEYAWTFLTEILKLDKERIYVSYFHGDPSQNLPCDTEAQNIWRKYLPEERILGFGPKENFWEMGATGPCGPCSEIHYDQIGDRDASKIVNQDDPDVIEIWNIVFMEYNRDETKLSPLPKKHIDTGMGLERVLRILQGERSNYNTDLFKPLFSTVERMLGIEPYTDVLDSKKDIAYRVIADHSRTLAISLMDNVLPSNEGRGYTIRKILRRALGFQYMHLKKVPGLLPVLVEQVIGSMEPVYGTNIPVQKAVEVVRGEEAQFTKTLTKGLSVLMRLIKEAQLSKLPVPGEDVFILYDRYGFPVDLTVAVCEQEKVSVDTDGFKQAQDKAKALSKQTTQSTAEVSLTVHDLAILDEKTDKKPTDDTEKYSGKKVTAKVIGIKLPNQPVIVSGIDGNIQVSGLCGVILNRTSFYSEAGGQEGDSGEIYFMQKEEAELIEKMKINKPGVFSGKDKIGRNNVFPVKDTKKYGRYVVHIGEMNGVIGENVICEINRERRSRLAHAHTATHLLNYSLTKVLSEKSPIRQCGSLVGEDALRFDFMWSQTISRAEVSEIEETINRIIDRDEKVEVSYMPYKEAVKIDGIRYMPDEEYPERVRVVKAHTEDNLSGKKGGSIELCGGSHVSHTEEIGRVRIMTESSIARGIRRISAVCGEKAIEAEKEAEKIMKEEITGETYVKIRERLDKINIPFVEMGHIRESVEKVQIKSTRERKKHFEKEANRLKEILEQTEGRILFVCKVTTDTTISQAGKMVSPMINILERAGREGMVLYSVEGTAVMSGWIEDGIERVQKAFPLESVAGRDKRVIAYVEGETDEIAEKIRKEIF